MGAGHTTSVVLTEADNLLNQQAVDDKCLLAEFRSNQTSLSGQMQVTRVNYPCPRS